MYATLSFSMAHLRIERMANYLTNIDKITVILNHVQYFVFGNYIYHLLKS